MYRNQVVYVDEIGEVNVRYSERASRVSIRLKPFKGVVLSIPMGMDVDDAMSFLKSKKEWIANSLKKMEVKESRLTIFDESTVFKTRSFSLRIESVPRKNILLKYGNGELYVGYPTQVDVADDAVQEAIRYGIEEALRREAKLFLPGRLKWLARQHGFEFENVTIKNLKSRWGSCSTLGNINLNLHLMRLPDHLIDYVLLHELCHTREHNHGSGFWALMDKVTACKAKKMDSELKNYSTKIY